MEQVIVALFTEVRRHKPSVIYIPNIDAWYVTLQGTIALVTFQTMLRSIPPTDPVLVLATAECEKGELPNELFRDFFGFSRKNRMEIPRPVAVRNAFETLNRTQADPKSRKIDESTFQLLSSISRRSLQNSLIQRIVRRGSWKNCQLLHAWSLKPPPKPRSKPCRRGTINSSMP